MSRPGKVPLHPRIFLLFLEMLFCEIAEKDTTICAITAAMQEGELH